jgi:gliding motility-associated lipoprotein GldB
MILKENFKIVQSTKTIKPMKKQIALLFMLSLIIFGCGKKNKLDVDVSDVNVNINIKRLDKDIFQIDIDSIHKEIPRLHEKYGEFYKIYNRHIINIGSSNSKAYADNLQAFRNDYGINEAYNKVQKKFPDFEELEEKITNGFRHYRYYFPKKKIPAVYTFIGGFNQSIVIADSTVAIGLDKYLGRDCDIYDKLGWEKYRQKNMHKAKIPTDCIKSWAKTEWVFNDSIDNVLTNMLYKGRLLYFTKAMYPETHDTLITGFTPKELEWCKANEKHIWEYLIDKNILYSTDYMTINKMVNPAPFTSGFPRQSPGQAVNWLGWQIVRTYMERKPGTSLKELMNKDDYQQILSQSKYHP